MVLRGVCWELAKVFLHCGELCSTDPPYARHKWFPARPPLQERGNFHVGGISIGAALQAEPWHAETSRDEGQAKPCLSHRWGERGDRHGELCDVCPIREKKAVSREDHCLQFRKVLEHVPSAQHVCIWPYETEPQWFPGLGSGCVKSKKNLLRRRDKSMRVIERRQLWQLLF